MSLHLLEELGFEHAATWSLNQDLLSITYQSQRDTNNLLYAFVCNQIVRYVGMTERTFSNRMYGYLLPGTGQSTNIRVNEQIQLLLNQGSSVEVYCLGESEDIYFRGIRINLPSGIEIPLINWIADFHRANDLPCLWNKRGIRHINQREVNQEALDEIISEELPYQNVDPDENYSVRIFTDIFVRLRETYYRNGQINLGKLGSSLLGDNGESIVVNCLGRDPTRLVCRIDRKTNRNATVRLYLGNDYNDWVQANYNLDDMITVRILSPSHIQLL